MPKNNFFAFIFLLITACAAPSDKKDTFIPDNLSRRDKTRYQQYLIKGKSLYRQHCSNCHQPDGRGLASLYPPLAKSDYLMQDIPRATCISKNGQEGSIVVNNKEYNMKMPGVPTLTNLEVAEIMTYIANSWGNEYGFISVSDVKKNLENCAQ